jgi:hypothetical protein
VRTSIRWVWGYFHRLIGLEISTLTIFSTYIFTAPAVANFNSGFYMKVGVTSAKIFAKKGVRP